MSILALLLAAASSWALVQPGPGRQLMVVGPSEFRQAEALVPKGGEDLAEAYGGKAVPCREDYGLLAASPVPEGMTHLWVRFRGPGFQVRQTKPEIRDLGWRWVHRVNLEWVYAGEMPPEATQIAIKGPPGAAEGDALDCLLWTGAWDQAPVEVGSDTRAVAPDWPNPAGAIPKYLASANVNAPVRTFAKASDAWLGAFRRLGIKFVRFQGTGPGWDYRDPSTWTEASLADLKVAVRRARSAGVEKIMFGIHGLNIPRGEDGRLIEAEFDGYAAACARLVSAFGAEELFIEYWEPFNELDHPSFIRAIEKHGQNWKTVVRLYGACARAMKQANPRIKVGGPACCWPSEWAARELVELADGPVDFISWHQYATGSATTGTEKVLSVALPGGSMAQGVDRMAGAAGQRPELMITEFHVNYSAWKPVDSRVAQVDSAVFAASALAWLPRTRVSVSMIHDVLSAVYGLIGPAGADRLSHGAGLLPMGIDRDRIHLRPVAWVYRWFNELVRGSRIPIKGGVAEGEPGVPAVAWSADDTAGIMLVNPTDSPVDVAVAWDPQRPSAGGMQWRSVGPAGPAEGRVIQQAGVVRLLLPAKTVVFCASEQ